MVGVFADTPSRSGRFCRATAGKVKLRTLLEAWERYETRSLLGQSLSGVRRQLLLRIDDNHFSLSTTTTL